MKKKIFDFILCKLGFCRYDTLTIQKSQIYIGYDCVQKVCQCCEKIITEEVLRDTYQEEIIKSVIK